MATMDFKALVGCGYFPFSRKADCQKSINLRRERVISDQGVNEFTLYKTPGLLPYQRLKHGCLRGMLSRDTGEKLHAFAVSADTLYDFRENQTPDVEYGPIDNDGLPVFMAASPTTLMLTSAGKLYRVNGGALVLVPLPFFVIKVVFLKNYFVILSGSLQQFYWSSDDGATWPLANVQTFESDANAAISMEVIFQQLAIIGTRITQWYSVIGNANKPFSPNDSGVMNSGTLATASVAKLGDSLIWLEKRAEGQFRIVMTNGYTASPISDNAVANKIREYAKAAGVSDAIGMAYEINGHEMYRIAFPSSDATWEYNKTVSQVTGRPEWCQVAHWDWLLGVYHRHRSNCMMTAFERTLVGDFENGIIYEMGPEIYHDAGFPLRWERQCPHILEQNKQVGYERLELGVETGVGLETPLWLNAYSLGPGAFATALAAAVVATTVTAAQALVLQQIYDVEPYAPLDAYPTPDTMIALGFFAWGAYSVGEDGNVTGGPPLIRMSYSDDGAKTFGAELSRSLGAAGTNEDVFWDRLGAAKDRVYNLNGDGPCKLAITTSWVEAEAFLG